MTPRQKVAPWELYTDGEWHEVRNTVDDEPRQESLRVFARHKESLREWASRNGYAGQLSRRDNGRSIKVRLTPRRSERRLTRDDATQAVQLIKYALHLRMHGERPPGGDETWAEFDRRAEAFLRGLAVPS
jgi:hypothetical protein